MRIGIDIDNTLTDIEDKLSDAAYQYAIKLGKKINNRIKIEDKGNDGKIYQELFGFTPSELRYFLTDIQESITDAAIPRKDAVSVLTKLKEEGHDIVIITARDTEYHEDPYLQSKTWLDQNHIPYDKLIVNARDKQIVCKQENIRLLIDDSISNCLKVKQSGIDTIRVYKENDQKYPIVTFDNWKDIYSYIKKRYPRISRKLEKELMTEKIVLERATIDQVDEIRAMYSERMKWFQRENIKQWSRYLENHPLEEFLDCIKNGNYYILTKVGNIIGGFELTNSSIYWNDYSDSYYICKIVTKVGTKKIGALILKTCKDLAVIHGKKSVRLDCLTSNKKLNMIYETYGFRQIKTGHVDGYSYTLREYEITEERKEIL